MVPLQISEIVGADLDVTGKKMTMELLDKYNIFSHGPEIGRIVKAANLELQLDCLISELKRTWFVLSLKFMLL